MTNSIKTLMMTAAISGLLGGAAIRAQAQAATPDSTNSKTPKVMKFQSGDKDKDKDKDKHSCKGKNDCKGKGGCKASDNGCKGKNSCKGKGGCATDHPMS